MIKEYPKIICDRCGEEVYKRELSLDVIKELGKGTQMGLSIKEYASKLSELAGVPIEVATDWANHGLFQMCKEKKAHCPYCGGQLRTWKARQCMHCLKDWHD